MAEHTPGPEQDSRDGPPDTVGRYRIEGYAGKGSAGRVYRAFDPVMDRTVALKEILQPASGAPELWESVRREAQAASALRHDAIVTVHDVIEEQGRVYIVEEFVEGAPLRTRLSRPMDLGQALKLAIACASALETAHGAGIVHCDLKPENILLTPEGNPRILDFGIARRLRSTLQGDSLLDDNRTIRMDPEPARPAVLEGTPAYLSPEQIRGEEVDARADLFAFGILLYEMATGKNPFLRPTLPETLRAVLDDEPPPPSSLRPRLPARLNELITGLLRKDPGERPSLAVVVEQLELLRRRFDAGERRRRRRLILAAIPVVAVLVLLAVTAIRGLRPERPDSREPAPLNLGLAPIRPLAQTPEDELFALGITDAIHTRLAQIPGVLLAGPGAESNPELILEGTLQRLDDRIRIRYRLVDPQQGVTVAGQEVEGSAADLFGLQDSVAVRVVRDLRTRRSLAYAPNAGARPTADLAAYDYYLRARGHLYRLRDRGDLESAAEHFRKALDLDPQFSLARAGLGETYLRLYRETQDPVWLEKAGEISRQAVEAAPDLPEAHLLAGMVYEETGRWPEATKAYEEAKALDPRNPDACCGLARSLEESGRVAEAESAFLKAASECPADWRVQSELAHFYRRQGRLEESIPPYVEVTKLLPRSARAHSNLGGAYTLLGRYDEAIEAYEASIACGPDARTYSNLATVYRWVGRYQDAARTYERAMNLNPLDYRLAGNLAETCALLPGHEARADSLFRRAVELAESRLEVNPRSALIHAHMALFLAYLGRTDEGRRHVDEALRLGPQSGELLFSVSVAYEQLGDREAALRTARQAVESGYPTSAWEGDPALAGLVSDPRFPASAEPEKKPG